MDEKLDHGKSWNLRTFPSNDWIALQLVVAGVELDVDKAFLAALRRSRSASAALCLARSLRVSSPSSGMGTECVIPSAFCERMCFAGRSSSSGELVGLKTAAEGIANREKKVVVV